jgi:uncharacterized membrane protein YeaQ/YmgE (transglycosylase-associated protein family)
MWLVYFSALVGAILGAKIVLHDGFDFGDQFLTDALSLLWASALLGLVGAVVGYLFAYALGLEV